MPGSASDSPALRAVGLTAAAIALVGTVAFSREFGGPTGAVPLAVGLLFAAVGVLAWLRSR